MNLNSQELRDKIQVLIGRNLLLPIEAIRAVKENLHSLRDDQLQDVLNILDDLDQKQTKGIQKKLEEEPYFFKRLDAIVAKETQKEHLKVEAADKLSAEEELLRNLEDL